MYHANTFKQDIARFRFRTCFHEQIKYTERDFSSNLVFVLVLIISNKDSLENFNLYSGPFSKISSVKLGRM